MLLLYSLVLFLVSICTYILGLAYAIKFQSPFHAILISGAFALLVVFWEAKIRENITDLVVTKIKSTPLSERLRCNPNSKLILIQAQELADLMAENRAYFNQMTAIKAELGNITITPPAPVPYELMLETSYPVFYLALHSANIDTFGMADEYPTKRTPRVLAVYHAVRETPVGVVHRYCGVTIK